MASGLVRTSSILIVSDSAESVYRSVDEVPEPLRQKLVVATQGINSATILIADRRGREEIARAIRKLPSATQRRLFRTLSGVAPAEARKSFRVSAAELVGIMLAGSTALLVWLILSHNW
jgi:hypothetical protein